MSIDYYLVDKKNKRRFDVGNHRMVYELAIRELLGDDGFIPPRELFCLACAAHVFERVVELPECYVDPDPWDWAFDAARHASNIYSFCMDADWQVVLVNDCDDSLFEYTEYPNSFPVSHTVYW